ncbi:MAG: glycosyltransferase family 4 protein [Phycisphaeraceae bacterium]
MTKTDVLILSELAPWPLDHGGRLRVAYLAPALARLGLRVVVASPEALPVEAPSSLRSLCVDWPACVDESDQRAFIQNWSGPLRGLRRRLARHQGIDTARYAGALELVRRLRPRAVIGVGQHAPVMLKGLPKDVSRVWYAADDVVAFLLSCMGRESLDRWPSRLYGAALHTGLEVAFGGLDAIVGVSDQDQRWLSVLGRPGVGRVIANGVDLDVFCPAAETAIEANTAVFWGRLDFEPNVDGLIWFVDRVWPGLVRRHPGARFRVIGRGMHRSLERLRTAEGVEWVGAVDDVRDDARSSAVTVLPMRCGGGIKNKLLEALAMGRPVVCTSRALTGLAEDHRMPPVRLGDDALSMVSAIEQLWANPASAARLGRSARAWAERHASWDQAARAFAGLLDDCDRRAGQPSGVDPRRLDRAA